MLDAHRSLLALFASLAVVVIGCERDDTTVRAIQAQRQKRVQTQSKQDHLGEAFNLLQSYVDLNKDKARRQIAYHLNRWLDVRPVDTELSMPEMLRTIREIVPPERLADDFERTRFAPSDINHLRDCYLFRKVTEWVDSERSDDPLLADWLEAKAGTLSEEDATKLRTATRLFDWTVRNIAIEPKVMPENTAPPLPLPLPLGMKFRGAGYRQSDYHTLWRGTGDSLQRAGVFTHLCRQVSIPAFVLAIPVSQTGELKPWCVGVLIGEEVYLFEPELGMFVPGPSQVGIATLSQARSDASVMRRLSVPGFFDYPYSKQDVQQVTALLNVTPEWVAVRMKHLEQGLTGDRRLIAYADIEAEGEQIDAVAGIAGVRLWKVPLLNRVYTAVLEKAAQREVMFGFWYYSRWAIMDAPAPMSEELSRGRWRHLHGMFDSSEDGSIEGARTLYLAQRAPEFEIEKLDIDVELQKAYGIRRELGVSQQDYERQLVQMKALMQLGKRTATYWLSLVQYDDQLYDTAENWLAKRSLNQEQRSFWEPAAQYNLARTRERLGQPEQAIELYKTDRTPQEHGNRIRARLLGRR